MTTFCRDCDNVHVLTRKEPPWKWRCTRVKTHPGFGFVDPTYAPEPPYERCSVVRDGPHCEMFELLRVAPEEVK